MGQINVYVYVNQNPTHRAGFQLVWKDNNFAFILILYFSLKNNKQE